MEEKIEQLKMDNLEKENKISEKSEKSRSQINKEKREYRRSGIKSKAIEVPDKVKVPINARDLTGEKPASRIQIIDSVQYYVYGDDFIALAPLITGDLLTTLTLDGSTTEINQYAFRDCSGLTRIDLSNCTNLTIGSGAFAYCSGLISVTINEYVFRNVTSTSTSCGYILYYIDSSETVLVPANLIDDLGLTNSYLNGSSFTRSETAVDGYYVYTKI